MSNSTYKSNRGFTIVELLIVIVVIAILAAISIVAYNGVQARTNNTAAATAAENVAKKLDIYNSINSSYPAVGQSILSQLANDASSSLTGSGITLSNANPSGDARRNTVYVQLCDTSAPAANAATTGYHVFRWDFDTNAWKTAADRSGGNTGSCAAVGTGTTNSVQ